MEVVRYFCFFTVSKKLIPNIVFFWISCYYNVVNYVKKYILTSLKYVFGQLLDEDRKFHSIGFLELYSLILSFNKHFIWDLLCTRHCIRH